MEISTKFRPNGGQLLIEMLIVISVAVIIISAAAQLIYVSSRSNKSSGEINVALGLSEETFEAVRGVSTEKWQNIYNRTGAAYYPRQLSGKWSVATGTEAVAISELAYNRSFAIQNVCRLDDATRAITGITDSDGSTATCVTSGGSHDPSTQKITVTVSWPEADPIVSAEYITRWRNKVCVQSDWTGQSSVTSSCPTSLYGEPAPSNITTGSNLQLTP